MGKNLGVPIILIYFKSVTITISVNAHKRSAAATKYSLTQTMIGFAVMYTKHLNMMADAGNTHTYTTIQIHRCSCSETENQPMSIGKMCVRIVFNRIGRVKWNQSRRTCSSDQLFIRVGACSHWIYCLNISFLDILSIIHEEKFKPIENLTQKKIAKRFVCWKSSGPFRSEWKGIYLFFILSINKTYFLSLPQLSFASQSKKINWEYHHKNSK